MVNQTRVSQHITEIAHNGEESNAVVSQHVVQVLTERPDGIHWTDANCTGLYSDIDQADITESGLSWAVLDNDDASAVTDILDQNNNGNINGGNGFFTTEAATGTYIVVVQNGTGKIGAYIMDVS